MALFDAELERLRTEFEKGDFLAVPEALRLCAWNQLALPAWLGEEVIRLVDLTMDMPTRRGPAPTRMAAAAQKEIDGIRFRLVAWHLQNRVRQGRRFASMLADFGDPVPGHPELRFVTEQDIYAGVSRQLRGTWAQGSARAIKDSYDRVRRRNR